MAIAGRIDCKYCTVTFQVPYLCLCMSDSYFAEITLFYVRGVGGCIFNDLHVGVAVCIWYDFRCKVFKVVFQPLEAFMLCLHLTTGLICIHSNPD